MAPLTIEKRKKALSQPGASEALLEEYERRVSEFFMFDPDMLSVDEELTRFARLEELHAIFFPGEPLVLSPTKTAATS